MKKRTDEDIRREVARMRLEGKRYEQICEELDISPSAVGRHSRELIRLANEAAVDDAKCIRIVEESRLEAAASALWARVVEGDEKVIETWLKVHTARAKMWDLANIPAGEKQGDVKSKLLRALLGD